MWRVAKTNEPEKAIQEGQGKIHYGGSSKLKEQVVAHMKKRSREPTTVDKLFNHPGVEHAADDNHSLPE